jgi:leucyl aminopeptidase
MPSIFAADPNASVIPITFATKSTWEAIRAALPAPSAQFAAANGYAAKPGAYLALPNADGGIAQVLFGLDTRLAALAFALGTYRFGRYRKADVPDVKLVPPGGVDTADITRMAEAAMMARDLINTPSNDMGPAELQLAAQQVADRHGARFSCITGDDLVTQNFPLIHAVGMASTRSPRLIDFSWGNPAHPKVTLVGKGVCFDTGGLDLKPSSGMLIMKKDMGGAANILALAHMVMDAKLKLRLRVLIPAVENAVAGNAFRPLDVFTSRKGITVEIGNTDAEGRLILADALALADEDAPDLLIDMGTLTGAARVALGPDLPPFYTSDEMLAADVARFAKGENDPVWRMPLWPPYDSWLDSKVATINNAPGGTFAGSIICALFLQRFVEHAKSWLHFDIYGWTPSAKPARPEGGECQAARAVYKLLGERYA